MIAISILGNIMVRSTDRSVVRGVVVGWMVARCGLLALQRVVNRMRSA